MKEDERGEGQGVDPGIDGLGELQLSGGKDERVDWSNGRENIGR